MSVAVTATLSAPGSVVVEVNGSVAATRELPAGAAQTFSVALPIGASSWIAVRAPRVQAGASYVIVGGRPIRPSTSAPRYFVSHIDSLLSLVDAGRFASRHDVDVAELARELQSASRTRRPPSFRAAVPSVSITSSSSVSPSSPPASRTPGRRRPWTST